MNGIGSMGRQGFYLVWISTTRRPDDSICKISFFNVKNNPA
jgi:hypothetical protein